MSADKDNYVTLINPQGNPEQVWDFADHVERMIAQGWKRPEKPATEKAATKTKKEN